MGPPAASISATQRDMPRSGTTYFPWHVLGYAIGLLLAFLANYFGVTINGVRGQPALLYLVPCTLGVHVALSYWKSELEEQWGQVETTGGDMHSGENELEEEEEEENGVAVSPSNIDVDECDEENDRSSLLS